MAILSTAVPIEVLGTDVQVTDLHAAAGPACVRQKIKKVRAIAPLVQEAILCAYCHSLLFNLLLSQFVTELKINYVRCYCCF